MTLPYPPPFMDLATLAEHICTGQSTIKAWVKEGKFPLPRKMGGRNLWRWKEVEKHLARTDDLSAASSDEPERVYEATRAALAGRH